MRGSWAIAMKDLTLILRDREALFWVLAFPLVMAVLFGTIFSGAGKKARRPIRVAVVDEDQSEASKAFVKRLKKSDSIKLKKYKFKGAHEAVRKGKIIAYVRIKKGYGSAEGFWFGDPEKIEVGIDPSRRAEKGFLQGILMKATFGALQDKMSDPKEARKLLKKSLAELRKEKATAEKQALALFLDAFDTYLEKVDGKTASNQMKMRGPKIKPVGYSGKKTPRSSFEISFPQAMVWGLLGIVATFATLIARERVVGTLLRLRISPLSWWHVLAGKGMAAFLACIVTIALIFTVGMVGFGLKLGRFPQLLLAVLATALCVTGLMMFISTLGKTEQAVGGAAWGVMMPLAMFGGGMIPLFMMPGWMQTASHLSPIKWAVYGFEGAIWRDFTVGEMFVPCAVLAVTGVALFSVGVFVLSSEKN